MNPPQNLSSSQSGDRGVITRIEVDRQLKKKLMSLGLRQGHQFTVLHHRQGGVVVLSNGSRVALGANIAARIFIESVQPGAQVC